MELIYLWVEDYKNIYHQGFNFSPRFECKFYDEYDENGRLKDNRILDIKSKKHIENFFSDKINITALVGKNGSGKSNVLEIIEGIYSDNLPPINLIFCFDDGIEKRCYSTITIDYEGSFQLEKINLTPQFIGIQNSNPFNYKFNFLTYSAEIPFPENSDRKRYFYRNQMAISLEEKDIYDVVANYVDSDFKLSTFMFLPQKIYISQNKEKLNSLLEEIHPEIGDEKRAFHEQREDFNTKNILVAYYVYQFIKNNLSHDLFDAIDSDDPTNYNYDLEVLENLYNDEKYGFNNNFNLKEFEELIANGIFEKDTLKEKERKLINKYKWFLKFNFEDKKRRKYSNLSHGEKTIYGQLLGIYHVNNLTKKPILILLDEPELSLHPQWQKKYINEIITLSKKINKTVHFVITSHSPFLISDISKQNIIFLDTYKKEDEDVKNKKQKIGNCKVLNHNEVLSKKQTFGANIHTLLSDSFFMEDGLMGEFAKNKIMQIQKFHKKVLKYQENKKVKKAYICFYNKKQKEFEQIQSIIGEPFLKTVIKNYLDEVENILFDDAKAKKMAIKRFVDEFDKDDIMKVLNDKS